MFWGRLVLPLALLSLCSLSAGAHQPDHHCMRRSFWKELMRGLENINPIFTPECRGEYEASLETPSVLPPAGSHKASTVVAVLQGMMRLFSVSDAAVPRNQRVHFLNGVSEILSQLQTCIKSPPAHNTHQAVVQARFQKLEQFLQTKGNSRCAWEIVHAVTREILHELTINHARK